MASLEMKLALPWSLCIHPRTVIFCNLEGSSSFLFYASSLQGKYCVLQNTVVTTQLRMSINNLLLHEQKWILKNLFYPMVINPGDSQVDCN